MSTNKSTVYVFPMSTNEFTVYAFLHENQSSQSKI